MRKRNILSSTRALFLIAAIAFVIIMAACGGGGGGSTTTPVVSITVSPTTATLAAGATQQFTATVSNATSTTAAWQVNGVTGGNASVGTISTGGLYTAPAVAPTPNTVTVTAIAVADSSKTANATVTIQKVTGIAISPNSAKVATGTTLKFTAAIDGTATNAVNWLVNGIAGGNSTVGTIDTAGTYTAPVSVPDPATVTVTAVSQADNTKTATASVTVGHFSNASLKGSYTFLLTGIDSKGPLQNGGVITVDGNGYITVGSGDFIQGDTKLLKQQVTGFYSIDPVTGVGTLHMETAGIPFDVTLAISGPDFAYFVESDGYGNASGALQRQDPAAFSTAAINGNYVFTLSGSLITGSSASSVVAAGRFGANGGGTLSSGLEDISNGGTFTPLMSLSGTYSIDTNGRGTGTFVTANGTTNMVFYVVDANTLRVMSADSTLMLTGRAEKQTGTISAATVNGNYILSSSGSFVTSNGYAPVNAVELFKANGAGSSTGSRDEMYNGTASLQLPFTGTYTVDSNGRMTSTTNDTNGSSQQAAWFVNPQRAFLVFADANRVEGGVLDQQTGTSFGSGSVNGPYGFSLNGVDYGNKASGEYVDVGGSLTADGNGALSITQTTTRDSVPKTSTPTGTYTVDATGRGIVSVSDGSNLVFYVVNDSKLNILQTDRFTQISGGARKQY